MRDPLIEGDGAWADFLNGIFLRRVWRQPSTVATSMEVADKSSQRPSMVDRQNPNSATAADKQYGKGPIMQDVPAETISTGSIALDLALGTGGLPRGHLVEIYGLESLDKTTLALHAVANAQQGGGEAAFIDTEHGWDPKYATNLGVDLEALTVAQPKTGEEFLDLMEMLTGSSFDVVIIGSPSSLVPHSEKRSGSDSGDGVLPWRLFAQAIRQLCLHLHSTNTMAIFLSPFEEKSGDMADNPDSAGGKALKFYASVRIDVRRIETLKDGTATTVGNRTRAKIVKNKLAPPFKQAEFDIIYGTGVSRESGLIDMGVEHGFVIKSGTRFIYNGVQLGQDRSNACKFLRLNPEHADALERRLRGRLETSERTNLTRQILSSTD